MLTILKVKGFESTVLGLPKLYHDTIWEDLYF